MDDRSASLEAIEIVSAEQSEVAEFKEPELKRAKTNMIVSAD